MRVIQPDAVYTVDEVAALLGLKAGAVRQWIRQGRIKAGRLGKSYLILGSDLLADIRASAESRSKE